MDFREATKHMQGTASAVESLISDVSDKQATWKPDADSWSILEVINHLYDEEREDFRVRLDILLHRPGDDWPSIDPQGWVISRKYNDRAMKPSLQNFLQERTDSLKWLESLKAPDLTSSVVSKFGRMAAGDMLAAWVAHDLLHLRQIIELKYAYTVKRFKPYSPGYAGDW